MSRSFKALRYGWAGSRSNAFDAMVKFVDNVIGLESIRREDGLSLYTLPDGAKFAVFSNDQSEHTHYTTGPVPAFLVDNLDGAVAWLTQNDVSIVDGPHRSVRGPMRWVDFRGPDGYIYQFIEDPSVGVQP